MAKFNSSDDNKKKEVTPIHSFAGLKNLLNSMGYNVRSASGYKVMKTVDIGRAEIRNIIMEDDGIYYRDEDGELRKIYMYKRNYRLTEHGKPRFHIRQCETIRSFMMMGTFNQEYRGANVEAVKVRDKDNFDKETTVTDLPLCTNCWNMARNEFPYKITSREYVEKLKAEGEPLEKEGDVEVDFRGCTKDWKKIEIDFKAKKNHTCESCHVIMKTPFDYHFLYVHHKNEKPADNRESNLACLCPECYFKVRKTPPTLAEKKILDDFLKKYRGNG